MSHFSYSPNSRESSSARSEDYGELQLVIDALYSGETKIVSRVDVIIGAEAHDLSEDLLEVVAMLPPGRYTRQRLCDQLNSTLAARGWGRTHGIVS